MSFILEALKKSETERQRTVGPSLADVPVSVPRETKPWWAFAVGALLLINLIVLVLVLLRGAHAERPSAPSSTAAIEQPIPATQAPSATVASTNSQPRRAPSAQNPAVRSLADEAMGVAPIAENPLDYPGLAAAARVPEGPPIVRPLDTPATSATAAHSTGSPVPPPERAEVLPTLQDLAAGGTQLPDMHLDIHVHSPVPAERFVFVNMRKYVEGETLAEGPTLEQITRDGIVLNHRGIRFLLPKQ